MYGALCISLSSILSVKRLLSWTFMSKSPVLSLRFVTTYFVVESSLSVGVNESLGVFTFVACMSLGATEPVLLIPEVYCCC